MKKNIKDDPNDIFAKATNSFQVMSYFINYISEENLLGVPSIAVSKGETYADKPHGIIYFHYTYEEFIKSRSSFDEVSGVYYLHYTIEMLENIINLLRSDNLVECFYVDQGDRKWTGLRSKNIPKKI